MNFATEFYDVNYFQLAQCTTDDVGRNFVAVFLDTESGVNSVMKLHPVLVSNDNSASINVIGSGLSPAYAFQKILRPRNVEEISLPQRAKVSSDGIARNVLTVTSTRDISLSATISGTAYCGSTLLFPTEALGRTYYVVGWEKVTTASQFIIANPSSSDLSVEIAFPNYAFELKVNVLGKEYIYGQKASNIVIPASSTLHIRSTNKVDLSGTYIVASAPVAVFAGNRNVNVRYGNLDILMEQMPPTRTYGNYFLLTNFPKRYSPYYIRLVAGFRRTTVTYARDGFVSRYVLQEAGRMVVLEYSSSESGYIQSDQPIMAVQISPGAVYENDFGAPAMMTLVSTAQFKRRYEFVANNATKTTYVTIIVRSGDRTSMVLDGKLIVDRWSSITGSDYVHRYEAVKEGIHRVYSTDGRALFAAYIYSANDRGCATAWPAGSCANVLQEPTITTPKIRAYKK